MTSLFDPFKLKSVTLKNRIAIPPMCQYSADDGVANEWHDVHYTGLARGGAGLIVVEATAVSPEGRITPKCLGIWNDEQAQALAKIAKSIKENGSVAGIQIGHAGRKASANIPWEGDDHIKEGDPKGWETLSPSAVAFGANLPKVPKELSIDEIHRIQKDFVDGAIRAREAGFEWLELHFSHGYLAQSFLSVHANKRTDEYGGDLKGRSRFILETVKAVREVWPEDLPLTARLGVIEFDGRDEETMQDAITVINEMKALGIEFVSVTLGFSTCDANIPWGPAFMAPIAERVRKETGLPVTTAWGMDNPQDAEKAVAEGQMDLVLMGHAHLQNPHYTYQVARELGVEDAAFKTLPSPYAHWLAAYKS